MTRYASFVLAAAPFTACNFVMNSALKSEGSATFAMFGTAIGGIVNCLLDPVFVFYAGLGVQGASLATAISKVVSFLVLRSPYLRGKSALYLSIRCFLPTAEIMRQIFSIGVGSLLRNGLCVLASIVLNCLAGGISDSLLAGIGVTTRIMQFPFGFALGFSNGLQVVAGFNWGARRFDRVWDSY